MSSRSCPPKGQRVRVRTIGAGLALALVAAALVQTTPAAAFKPFTHMTSANVAVDDVLDDGRVTIDGEHYTVDPRVVAALRQYPQFYNAGVIGPDGFPDIAYGQGLIHPEETGEWLQYLFERAWEIQTDPNWSVVERGQVLAFTYGYLSHAAGDMWAHTLVNAFAEGVFPSPGELVEQPKARVALRHLVVEGYIGAATPRWDGEETDSRGEWEPVCSATHPKAPRDTYTRCTTKDGNATGPSYSDVSTPGIEFDAPHRFVHEMFVNLDARTPLDGCRRDANGFVNQPDDDDRVIPGDGCIGGPPAHGEAELNRGKALNVLLDLQAKLQVLRQERFVDKEGTDCDVDEEGCVAHVHEFNVSTVRGNITGRVSTTRCKPEHAPCDDKDLADRANDVLDGLIVEYLDAWLEDLTALREHWSEVSLAIVRGLFDPQTRRDAQDEKCWGRGAESPTNDARRVCESGVGTLSTIIHAMNEYPTGTDPKGLVNAYIVPALGLPDGVGDALAFLTLVGDYIDELLLAAGLPNMIREAATNVSEYVGAKITELILDQTGIDREALGRFNTLPARWMCGDDGSGVSVDLLGYTYRPSGIFKPHEHELLDSILGLPADHHVAEAGLPAQCGALRQDMDFDSSLFRPYANAVKTYRLLFLSGPELDRALGDVLFRAGVARQPGLVRTYDRPRAGAAPVNIMIDALGPGTWLKSIDSHHSWRADGKPIFCENRDAEPDCRMSLAKEFVGGHGNFPVWESCALRPAFRSLYDDWQNGNLDFPDLGDDPSPDPATDPAAPTTGVTLAGTTFESNTGTRYLGPGATATVTSTDAFFVDALLTQQYRVAAGSGLPGSWTDLASVGSVPFAGLPDGPVRLQTRASDPCHPYSNALFREDVLVIDTSAPAITITGPATDLYDSDDLVPLTWTADDGAGSGVKSTAGALDGTAVPQGSVDAYDLAAGTHTLAVSAVDQLGNSGTASKTFRIRATAASLLGNLERAAQQGLVRQGIATSLRAKLQAAVASHERGQHATEHNQLRAFISELEAQSGRGVDQATAQKLIAFTTDLIESNG